MKRFKPDGMLIANGNSFMAMSIMNENKRGEYVLYSEAKELEAKAVKWDDPQTQADLELAQAVRMIGEQGHKLKMWNGDPEKWFVEIEYKHFPMKFWDWYREQNRGAE